MRAKQPKGISKPSLLNEYMEKYGSVGVRRRSDIALRAAKIEAELAYKARGTFLESMNHELRTPLNAIFGFGNMLKHAGEYELDHQKVGEYIGYILTSAELLLAHIDTLLELAAIESGGAKMMMRPCNLAEILTNAVKQCQQSRAAQGIRFSVLIDDNVPLSKVDPDKIQSAFTHILSGAISQCSTDDEISVICKAGRKANEGSWIYTAVSDTGCGMTPEELDRAMRMFDHTQQWLNRQIEGFGLGLPIARSFTELNKGKFSIQSTKNRGTIVRMAFPSVSGAGVKNQGGENLHEADLQQTGQVFL